MEKLVLIDGNSILYRAFYATPYFATKTGVQTNAVYGFINMLIKLIQEVKPDYMLVAFDRKEPTYRHKMYEGYKATRKPMPEELVSQVPLIKKLLTDLGIRIYEKAGLEADDIIGSAAKTFSLPTFIVTGDKDSFQLVDESTSVLFTRKGISETELYSIDNFKEKTGIEPIQIIDLKACMGDSSDNIPGIKGIGEKTALDLVSKFGSIENLYEHTDELKGKLKEKVEEGKESAFLSKTLATIDVKADLNLTLQELKLIFPFAFSTRRAFNELEFNSILKKDIFSAEPEKAQDNSKIEFIKKNEIKQVILESITPDIIAFESEIVSIAVLDNIFISDGKTEWKLKIQDNVLENFFDKGITSYEAFTFVLSVLKNSKLSKIVYDKKKLMRTLDSFNFDYSFDCDDVMLEKYVVDYTQKEMNLTEALEHAGFDVSYPAASLLSLHEKYLAELEKEDNLYLYKNVELPLADVLFSMEKAGFKIETNVLNAASEDYKKRLLEINNRIMHLAGQTFNPNSPKQLAEILFEKLGLKHGKKTKTGYSTGAEVLEEMVGEHPIIPLILEYRQIQKLLSTYIEGFKPLIDRNTGLIHTVFNQTVTSTGRLSSKEPNLQNIPVRDEEGREIRKFFIPRNSDGVIISADYSQIELRLLAHYSGCKKLIDAFNNGADIHAITASEVFKVNLNDVTKEQRSRAKAVNFGIIYGISEYGLAKNLKISPKTAADYIKNYFDTYPEVKDYMNKNVEFAKANGYVCTAYNRRRFIPEIASSNYNVRSFGERAAMNMPLQGTAADIIKIAMNNVYRRLKKEVSEAILILQVHDELIVDAPKCVEANVKRILEEEMTGAAQLSVQLSVNVSSGKNWFEAK